MRLHAAGLAVAGLLGLGLPAAAEVTRFELAGPPQPVFDGRAFGGAGPYERLTARATLALDPADPRNAVIADLALAPRNAQGRVEAVAEVVILRPADPLRGEGLTQLRARAQAHVAAREVAAARDDNFDFAEVFLQLALVLGSIAILAINRPILWLASGLGLVGSLLTANGFLLAFPLPS